MDYTNASAKIKAEAFFLKSGKVYGDKTKN